MIKLRLESDSLGSVQLPADSLYGAITFRGQQNFDVSSQKLSDLPEFICAIAQIKQAAAAANRDIGVLKPDIADAIIAAASEVVRGLHTDHFVIDMMEGSGGTSINMNVNEVVANRAIQLIGGQIGSYDRIHPNDHVNIGQSTNDVVPSAAKLAIYQATGNLIDALGHLGSIFDDLASTFGDVLRLGRTCMQGAQPMRLGQAFGGYSAALRRITEKLRIVRGDLLVLPLGGTAIGTGLGSAPGYREAVYAHLRMIVGLDVRPSENMFDAMQNADGFSRLSSEVRIAADTIARIASDLVILSSDPDGGIGELRLPVVQPGSSIMPGKVNPVLPMMMQQVAFAVAGNDTAVNLAALHGQMEINHFEPVITTRLLDSISLLTKSSLIFGDRCVSGIEPDRERSLENLMRSSAISTVFVAKLGYAAVSKLVQTSVATQRPMIDLAIEKGLLSHDDVMDVLLDSTVYCGS